MSSWRITVSSKIISQISIKANGPMFSESNGKLRRGWVTQSVTNLQIFYICLVGYNTSVEKQLSDPQLNTSNKHHSLYEWEYEWFHIFYLCLNVKQKEYSQVLHWQPRDNWWKASTPEQWIFLEKEYWVSWR